MIEVFYMLFLLFFFGGSFILTAGTLIAAVLINVFGGKK